MNDTTHFKFYKRILQILPCFNYKKILAFRYQVPLMQSYKELA